MKMPSTLTFAVGHLLEQRLVHRAAPTIRPCGPEAPTSPTASDVLKTCVVRSVTSVS